MDQAKTRLTLGVCGAVFCVASVFAFFAAFIYALAQIFGPLAGLLIVGALFLVVGGICMVLFLRPFVSSSEEVADLEEATADALADLPFDTVEAIIRKRPLASIGLALFAGYAGVRDPHRSLNQVQDLLIRLI